MLYIYTNRFNKRFCYYTAALLYQRVIVNKSAPVYKTSLLFGASAKSFKKTKSYTIMVCKPLFVVHVRVKGLYKLILEYKNEAPQLKKWAWHMHNTIV